MKKKIIQEKVEERLKLYSKHLETFNLKLATELLLSSDEYRTKEDVQNIVNGINNTSSPKIYKFTIDSIAERKSLIESYEIFQKLNKNRENSKKLSVSRYNNVNSKTLYIGSKMKDIKSRIKQHLGEGYYRTYAMQLNKWDSNINYSLKLEIFTIETNIEDEFKRSFIELIEQELWEKCKPIFGKKSGL